MILAFKQSKYCKHTEAASVVIRCQIFKRFLLLSLMGLSLSLVIGCSRDVGPISEMTYEYAIKAHGFQQLSLLALKGNPTAQLYVGTAYRKGQDVLKSNEDARRWIRRSANQGEAAAQLAMGDIVVESIKNSSLFEIEPLISTAYMWYELAAKKGNKRARNELAFLEDLSSENHLTGAIAEGKSLYLNWRACHESSCWDYEPNVSQKSNEYTDSSRNRIGT